MLLLLKKCFQRAFGQKPKIATGRVCLLVITIQALFFAPPLLLAQQRPTLDVPSVDAQGGLKLSLHGQAGTNYALEVSRSLNSWLPLASLAATNSQVDFQYSPGTNPGALYFRARVDTKLPPITLSVQTDTNLQTTTLITSGDGGVLSLIDLHGVTYSLTVPPQAVWDAQVVTMSLVDNLSGVPFSSGVLGTVSIEPEGLVLLQSAQLVITFPTNPPVNVSKLAAYGFASDGTQFHLTPYLPLTNSILLPLASLTSVGCSVATTQEILQQAQRYVADPSTLTNAVVLKKGRTTKGAYYDSCYPAEKTRAVFVGKGIENSLNAASQAMGAKLAANSQLPASDQMTIGQLNIGDDFNNFYRNSLDPYSAEMQTNCSMLGTVSKYFLGVERQAQLMGIETQPPTPFADLCSVFAECERKIDECCKIKGASTEAVIELIGISRQEQLMGCPAGNTFDDCPDCDPEWYGTVTYKDTYSNYEQIAPGSEVDWQYEFSTTLVGPTNLIGNPTGQGYYSLTGTLEGPTEGKNRVHSRQDSQSGCPGYLDTLKTSEVYDPVAASFQLVWSITNTPGSIQNGLLLFPIGNSVSTLAAIQATSIRTEADGFKDQDGNCQQTITITNSYPTDTYQMAQLLYNSSSITGTVNDVTGTFTTNWVTSDGAQWTRGITWDLHRKR